MKALIAWLAWKVYCWAEGCSRIPLLDDEVETTHFGTPGRTKEFKPARIDEGEASFELNWKPKV